MAREFSRTDRVGQQLHKEVASILQHEFKHREPDVGLVTVSGVEVSRDLAHAKVFITFFENNEEKVKKDLAKLQDSKGFVRTLLAKRLRMRKVPAVQFYRDGSILEGSRISDLVNKAVESDKARQQKDSGDDTEGNN